MSDFSPAEVPMLSPDQALDMYRQIVESFNPAEPMLVYSTATQALLAEMAGVAPEARLQAVAVTLSAMYQEHGPPRWVVLSYEGWRKEVPADMDVRRGELDLWARAGDTSVQTAVVIVGVSLTDAWTSITPFARRGVGVDWSQTSTVRGEAIQSDVFDLLLHAVR